MLQDTRWEHAAIMRWDSLLQLTALEERTTIPWSRNVLFAADKAAPTGFLNRAVLDLILGKVYGNDMAMEWNNLLSSQDVGEPPPPEKAAEGLAKVKADATKAALFSSGTTGSVGGRASSTPAPALTLSTHSVLHRAAGLSTEGKPQRPGVEDASTRTLLVRLWAELFVSYSTPITSSSPLAPRAAAGKGALFDLRMFAAAHAMLPAMKRNMEMRVALNDGLLVLATFGYKNEVHPSAPSSSSLGPSMARVSTRMGHKVEHLEAEITRADVECLLALPLYKSGDIERLQSSLRTAFLDALVDHRENGYPAGPATRLRAQEVKEAIFTAPSLLPWITSVRSSDYAAALRGALAAAAKRRANSLYSNAASSSSARGTARMAATEPITLSPLSLLEQCAVPSLHRLVKANKVLEYEWHVACAYNRRAILLRSFRRLAHFAARRRRCKANLRLAIGSYHYRASNALRDAFTLWRRCALRESCATTLQCTWRMYVAKCAVQRLRMGGYIAQQLCKLWHWRKATRALALQRSGKAAAASILQAWARGRLVKRRLHMKAVVQSTADEHAMKKLKADLKALRRWQAAVQIQRAWKKKQSFRFAQVVRAHMHAHAVHQAGIARGKAAIEAWVEQHWYARVHLDKKHPVPGKVGLSAEQASRRATRKLARLQAEDRKRRQATEQMSNLAAIVAAVQGPSSILLSAPSFRGLVPAGAGSASVRAMRGMSARATLLLARFGLLWRARREVRLRAMVRYERVYDLEKGAYVYWDTRYQRPVASWLDRVHRPVSLGPLHELPVTGQWTCRWDVRAPDGLHYFHAATHSLAWEQPAGTVLCALCSRSFAHWYCCGAAGSDEACGVPTCTPCFTNAHGLIQHMHPSLQAQQWERHIHVQLVGGKPGAAANLAVLRLMISQRGAAALPAMWGRQGKAVAGPWAGMHIYTIKKKKKNRLRDVEVLGKVDVLKGI